MADKQGRPRQLVVSRMSEPEVTKLDKLVLLRTIDIGRPISRSKLIVELVENEYERLSGRASTR